MRKITDKKYYTGMGNEKSDWQCKASGGNQKIGEISLLLMENRLSDGSKKEIINTSAERYSQQSVFS